MTMVTGNLIKKMEKMYAEEQADELLVEITASEMRKKLEKKRGEGRGGWFRKEFPEEELKNMLSEHVKKGDMIDIINIAAMIMVRGKIYGSNNK